MHPQAAAIVPQRLDTMADEDDEDERLPFVEVSEELRASPAATGLDARLCAALDRMGIRSLFAVQAATIPWLLRADAARLPADLCVCAPTGSGKTLAYALPIVHALLPRVVCRLRAVVVLPTRSLALQVHAGFAALTAGTPLAVGTALGDVPFALERARLVAPPAADAREGAPLLGGCSLVDILVATPGRLVDQLRAADGLLSLQHLRWVVIDEADRLMAQAYDQWLPLLLESAHLAAPPGGLAPNASTPPFCARLAQPALADRSRAPLPGASGGVRKLLFSATLTSDAHSLPALQLRAPTYLRIGAGRYAMPSGLHEEYAVCARALKPLLLIAALQRLRPARAAAGGAERVLCFTQSVDGAHRLTRVLQQLGVRALEYSSNLQHAARADALAHFSKGSGARQCAWAEGEGEEAGGAPFARVAPPELGCELLVASDAMARGLDIAGVGHVLNYDAPTRLSTYMHRAGRTARAGREGTCCTLVTRSQVKHFKAMLQQAGRTPAPVSLEVAPPRPDGGFARRAQPLPGAADEPLLLAAAADEADAARGAWISRYERALSSVHQILELERRGLLAMHEPVPAEALLADEQDDLLDAAADAQPLAGAPPGAGRPREPPLELGDGPRPELVLRRDRTAHLGKLMREQLAARAQEGKEERKSAARKRPRI